MTHPLVKLEKEALEFMKNSNYKDAIRLYEEIIAENPNWEHGYMYYHLAGCYEDSNQYDKARTNYLKSIELWSDDYIRWGGYASFLYLHGEPKEAYEAYLTLHYLKKTRGSDTDTTVIGLTALGKKLGMSEEEIKKDLEK